jgi:heme a synthase
MGPAQRLVLFRRLCWCGVALALLVVVLGAWVRLNAAGLGCPDWPGCYGHLTAGAAGENLDHIAQAFPQRPFEYAKAVKEMVHRYFASSLGLLCIVLAAMALRNRNHPGQPVRLPLILLGLVILQGLLGMWTVTLLLKPLIVTLHLLGGLATTALLVWLATQPSTEASRSGGPLRTLGIAALAMLVVQIFLGGWTSSNYAALACPDFPTCQLAYWPNMDAREAFVLWRGLGLDYEGGVLDHPARVAIHFTHRLGAVLTALLLGWLAVAAWRGTNDSRLRQAAGAMASLLVVQLILGPTMVLHALPLLLATAHNAVAALLLLSVVRLLRIIEPG